jgi:hypothetical protein
MYINKSNICSIEELILLTKMPLAKDIAAVVPDYVGTEDYIMIITNTGEKIRYTTRMRTVLKHIAYELCIDLAAIKKHTAKATQQTLLHPLPLAPDILLVPVKVRIPCQTGQPSIGYVNFYSITTILDDNTRPPYRSSIQLCGRNTIPVIWTSTTIKKQLRYARLSVSELPGYPAANRDRPHTTELRPLAQKLIELMYDILMLKQN